MARLFGTDGVRGVANADLSCALAMQIGAAGAYVLTSEVHNPRILVGMDTRRSGDMLAAALSAGICSVGGDVLHVGVIPTPAMAYLVRLYEADAAVMISASHNTMEYNGIKWFDGDGFKLSDALEDEIERLIREKVELPRPTGVGVGHMIAARRAVEEYKAFLCSTAETRFDGMRVALDCANGASAGIAADVFRTLGAEVIARSDEPDGYNINARCGSTHPEALQELVVECAADVGFAFDGDADRVIACDELGNLVDGDRIIGICGHAMQQAGTLKNDAVVVTVMSNLGLKKRMRALGIHVEETAVGDRYVMERMRQGGFVLGGEQSGHIIFLDRNTTGDGMLTAIQVLNVLRASGKRMSRLAAVVPIFPQVLVNVVVENGKKQDAMQDAQMLERIHAVEAELGEAGRVLVRASGTEPLIRIMLEGQDEAEIRALAVSIAKVLEKNHGGRIRQ